jgi:hypothetical protein
MPARKAILVWIGCALAGWVFALASIYSVVRFGDTLTAVFRGGEPTIADQKQDKEISDIAPAAGGSSPPAQ